MPKTETEEHHKTDSNRPVRISVIMPVFNCEKYFAAAVESILAQTFEDFEFIIIDDGSTDGTAEVLRDYASRDERIRASYSTNRGLTVQLNRALSQAAGQYVARMDGDDLALPNRFATQFDYLESHPQVVALGSRVQLIDADGETLMNSRQELEHSGIDRELLRGRGTAIVHPSAMFRRTSLEQIGGYVDAYNGSEDLDLYLRLAEIGQLCNLEQILLRFRRHSSSVSAIGNRAEGDERRRRIVADAQRRRGLAAEAISLGGTRHPRTVGESHASLARLAIAGGHFTTARKHAFKAMHDDPLSREVWKAAMMAYLGSPAMLGVWRAMKRRNPATDEAA